MPCMASFIRFKIKAPNTFPSGGVRVATRQCCKSAQVSLVIMEAKF